MNNMIYIKNTKNEKQDIANKKRKTMLLGETCFWINGCV